MTILLYDFGDPSLQGFFLPADIDPASGEAHSNQRQIFYINFRQLRVNQSPGRSGRS